MLVFMLFLCSAESFHYKVVFRVLMKHIKRTRWCLKRKKYYWPAPSVGAWLNTFCLASVFLPALRSHVSSHINAHSVEYFVLCGVHAPLHRTASYITLCSVCGVHSPLYLMVKIYWNKVSFATVRKARSCLVSIFLPVHKRLHFSLQIIAHSGRQACSSLCNSRRWNCLTLGETVSHSCSSSALCAMLLPTPRIRIFSSQKKVRFKFSPHFF